VAWPPSSHEDCINLFLLPQEHINTISKPPWESFPRRNSPRDVLLPPIPETLPGGIATNPDDEGGRTKKSRKRRGPAVLDPGDGMRFLIFRSRPEPYNIWQI
jgi:hypothetical protein